MAVTLANLRNGKLSNSLRGVNANALKALIAKPAGYELNNLKDSL